MVRVDKPCTRVDKTLPRQFSVQSVGLRALSLSILVQFNGPVSALDNDMTRKQIVSHYAVLVAEAEKAWNTKLVAKLFGRQS